MYRLTQVFSYGFEYHLFCWKLKIENNKKIIFELLFTPKTLFICLFAQFMSHKQCNRRFLERKEKNAFVWKCRRNPNTLKVCLLDLITPNLRFAWFFYSLNYYSFNVSISSIEKIYYYYIRDSKFISLYADYKLISQLNIIISNYHKNEINYMRKNPAANFKYLNHVKKIMSKF